jgi:hypothetical protein
MFNASLSHWFDEGNYLFWKLILESFNPRKHNTLPLSIFEEQPDYNQYNVSMKY